MNTSAYHNLITETQNWEDFVLEGGGALGCCGVNHDYYTNSFLCKSACAKKCTNKNHKPVGCTQSVPNCHMYCCTQWCEKGSIPKGWCAGVAACKVGPPPVWVAEWCFKAPTPRTITITAWTQTTPSWWNRVGSVSHIKINTVVGCTP